MPAPPRRLCGGESRRTRADASHGRETAREPIARGKFEVGDISRRSDGGTAFPNQSAEFDVALNNIGPEAVSVIRMNGSLTTPAVALLDAAGREVGRFTNANLIARAGVELEPNRLR